MEKIEIKSLFTDWHEVSREQAKDYVKFLLSNITTKKNKELVQYIESNKLRGITIKELFEEGFENERV